MKPHIIPIILIVLSVPIVFYSFLFPHWDELQFGDMYSYRYRMEIPQISREKYHDDIPLWSPYTMSGAPFFSKPGVDIGFFYLNYVLLMVLPLTAALKLSYIIPIILAGIAMYWFMLYLKVDRKYALLAAFVYMFNGWIYTRLRYGHMTSISPYTFTPLIIMFLMKTLKEKRWIRNAIITGVLLGVQIHAGPDLKITLWIAPIIVLYGLFYLMGGFSLQRVTKLALAAAIIGIVTLGLTAVKVLPAKDYLALQSRAGLTFDQADSQKIEWKDWFGGFIQPWRNYGAQTSGIGILAALLAILAIVKKWKSKVVLYLAAIAVIYLFLGTGSKLFYLFWKYIPLYASFRYPIRIMAIYTFAMAALAGIGAALVGDYLTEKLRWSSKKVFMATSLFVLLVFLNNLFINVTPYRGKREWINPDEALADNHVLQYISKQPGIFRMHTFETNGIDWGTEFQNIPLGLQTLYGYDAAWLVDYMNIYLSQALQEPAKFWGILNTKYVTSQTEQNITGLRLVQKFPECSKCVPGMKELDKIGGPYLYENDYFLPRAYIVPNAILIVGKQVPDQYDEVKAATYALMHQPFFNPSSTVIIMGEESINEYSLDELSPFRAVILTANSVDQSSFPLLEQYKQSGGIIIPDVVAGATEASLESILPLLSSPANLTPVDNQFLDFDTRTLHLGNRQGFLVYSEVLTYFPGWKAYADGKELDILRADGVIAALYLDAPTQEVTLIYKPRSFVVGAWITIITIVALLLTLGVQVIKN